MISPVQAREAVHLLLLRRLQGVAHGQAVTLKGGVNLRLFFFSRRYSEDVDLDADGEYRLAITSAISGIFDDRSFAGELRSLGLRGVDPKEGPNKDTETTYRYRFHVLAPAGHSLGTKVEISFRDRHPADRSRVEAPDPEILAPYGIPAGDLRVGHYVRESAIRQKIAALAGRTRTEARDVFDVDMLLGDSKRGRRDLVAYLRSVTEPDVARIARERALTLGYGEYEALVVRFLADEVRGDYATQDRWDEMRLRVALLLEAIERGTEEGDV